MAQQLANKDGTSQSPSRYTEQRAPQFVGGSTDPDTGNIITSSRSQAQAAVPSAESETPAPAAPTTRLGDISASPSYTPAAPYAPPKASLTDSLLPALGSAAISAGAKGIGSAFGSGGSSSSSSGPTAGGFAPGGDTAVLNSSNGSGSGYNGGYSGAQSVDEGGFSGFTPSPGPEAASITSGGSAPSYSAPSYSPAPPPSGGYDSGGGGDDGGSGSVVCTELHRQGLLVGPTYEADQAFGVLVRKHHPEVYAGYIVWARPCVRLMQRSARFTRFVHFIAAPWADTMALRMGQNGFPTLRGYITFQVGWAVCAVIGRAQAMLGSSRRAVA